MSSDKLPDNWIVTLAHNCLSLTQQAVASFLAQDIGDVRVLVVNNESRDGTMEWLQYANTKWGVEAIHLYPQMGVAHGWNRALEYLFETEKAHRVLVCNNDVVLRPDTYTLLNSESARFVTAVGYHDRSALDGPSRRRIEVGSERRPHPDFSCFWISKDVWRMVGPFDENFRIAYAEDWDYHVRMHAAGIVAYCIDVPFLHVGAGAQTIKSADPKEAEAISAQAAKNRAYFACKWGFEGGSDAYYAFFNRPAGSGLKPAVHVPESPRD